jgi:4,5-epoxidase
MWQPCVLVVGAGPTGLTLACDLRSRGIDAQVVDRRDGPAPTTRALGLQPRGRQILDRLGALGDLPDLSALDMKFTVFVDGRPQVCFDLDTLAGPTDDGVLRLPQTEIELRLRRRLAALGAEVRWRTEIVGAEQSPSRVTITLRTADGEQTVQADWLIGCDGAHSAVRKLVQTRFDGSAFPQTFMLADVRFSATPKHGPALYLERDQLLAVAPLPSGEWRIGATLPADHELAGGAAHPLPMPMTANPSSGELPSTSQLTFLQELFAARSGDTATRLLAPSWFSVFRINRRTASSFRRDRIFIAGDAAHLSSPLGGQGMNSGLADAFNLGWKLALVARGLADARLLDSYQAERKPATERIERATTQFTRILLGGGVLSRFLRRVVVLPMMRRPALQRWVFSGRPALRSSYRHGPLGATARRWLARAPGPGDEAPDVRCRRADGAPTSLGREIGADWGLICFGGAEADLARCAAIVQARLPGGLKSIRVLPAGTTEPLDRRAVLDPAGALQRAFHAGATTTILLRPDGYIACRAPRPDAAAISDWLDRILRLKPARCESAFERNGSRFA